MNILSLLAIGFSLAMDTFSLSLILGTSNNKYLLYSFIVGIFHYLMPFMGSLLGNKLFKIFIFSSKYILSIVYIFIIIGMILGLKENNSNYKLTIYKMIMCAFAVSVDSFTIGIAISKITIFPQLGFIIFSIEAFIFTYIGMLLGKKSYEFLGNISQKIGILVLSLLLLIELI